MDKVKSIFIMAMLCIVPMLHSINADVYDIKGRFISEITVPDSYTLPLVTPLPSTSIDIFSRCVSIPRGLYLIKETPAMNTGSIIGRQNPFFVDATNSLLPLQEYSSCAVVATDFNGDGFDDIFFSIQGEQDATDNQPRIYIRQANGSYADETSTRLPEYNEGGEYVNAFDYDNDGDMDILLIAFSYGTEATNSLFINDGTGHFSLAPQGILGEVNALDAAIIDVNNDGYKDILYTAIDPTSATNYGFYYQLWLNQSGTHFEVDTQDTLPLTEMGNVMGFRAFPVDVNGDNLTDIILSNVDAFDNQGYMISAGNDVVMLNSGLGYFTLPTINPLPPDTLLVTNYVLSDVDNDGDRDIIRSIVSGGDDAFLEVLRNNGTNFVVDSLAVPYSNLFHNGILVEDFNLDGYPDIFAPCVDWGAPAADMYLMNNLQGGFDINNEALPDIIDFTQDTAIINNGIDQRKDVVLVTGGGGMFDTGQARIYLNTDSSLAEDHLAKPEYLSAYPNPFRTNTIIHTGKSAINTSDLKIYNLRGQLVRTLNHDKSNTNNTFIWNGDNDKGKKLSAGIYLMHTTIEGKDCTGKLLLLK